MMEGFSLAIDNIYRDWKPASLTPITRGPQLIPNHVDGFKNHYWNQRITPRFFIRNQNMLLKISNFSYTLNYVTHKPLFG